MKSWNYLFTWEQISISTVFTLNVTFLNRIRSSCCVIVSYTNGNQKEMQLTRQPWCEIYGSFEWTVHEAGVASKFPNFSQLAPVTPPDTCHRVSRSLHRIPPLNFSHCTQRARWKMQTNQLINMHTQVRPPACVFTGRHLNLAGRQRGRTWGEHWNWKLEDSGATHRVQQ